MLFEISKTLNSQGRYVNGQRSNVLISFVRKVNDLEALSSVSDKAKLFANNISKNSNLDDSGIPLPVFFFSRTNLKLHKISVTPKMVKRVITSIDSLVASGIDCITLVFL